ncbi:hypothetical protein, partial [Chryseobacterium sp. Leaf180]|uniref:hypothetical protein n=1 Tax=Chryseobacterium sp. Leaf180 TaxID=1736289 RepID=UPI00193114C9
MKKFYSLARRLTGQMAVASALLFTGAAASAQTSLAAGDLIFTSYDSSPLSGTTGDIFSFVLLTPTSAGTAIGLAKLSLARRLTGQMAVASALLFTGAAASAQTSLAAGDLIFTSYDSSPLSGTTGDIFSFVLLTPTSAGTAIGFTDRGYSSAGWQTTGGTESTIRWISGTALPAGTEVYIVGLAASTYNPVTSTSTANGTVTLTEGTSTNGLSLSNVGPTTFVGIC